MVANNNDNPASVMVPENCILTPYEEMRVFTFSTEKSPIHVVEVPGCKFHDLPVCLATAREEELAKVKWAVNQFQHFFQEAADKICGLKP